MNKSWLVQHRNEWIAPFRYGNVYYSASVHSHYSVCTETYTAAQKAAITTFPLNDRPDAVTKMTDRRRKWRLAEAEFEM